MPVDSDRARRTGAELIVENLKRQIALIASARHPRHEVDQRQVALRRKAAEMPAPCQHVHIEPGRVGKLHQKNAVAGNRIELPQIGLAGIDVEAVEHQPHGRMIGAANDFPGVAVGVPGVAIGPVGLSTWTWAPLADNGASLLKLCTA